MWDVQLFKLDFDENERNAVNSVLDTGWLAMGESVAKFENKFSSLIGDDINTNAVSSCTAALHLGLIALGVKPGDEVIIPSLTFIAAPNVVEIVGATPVLADCKSLDHWNMSLENIKKVVTKKTKVIMVVHFAGVPCEDIAEIREFCKNNQIGLLEDAAHAPGASIHGKMCGNWGDIACFSFYSNKNISIGEGGATTTSNLELHNQLKYLRAHGMTSVLLDRHKGRSASYEIDRPGLNYRMDEIRAAIGMAQLKKLQINNKKRELLVKHYINCLDGSKYLIPFLNQANDSVSSNHIMPILLPENVDRDNIINYLKENRIQSSIHYPAFWTFNAYKKKFLSSSCPISSNICKKELTLPLYPSMTFDEVEVVTKALLKYKI
jgi:dTDP-4-amino-4,6-dideoxygalactose transaminase